MSTRKLTLKSETLTRASDEVLVLSSKQQGVNTIYPEEIVLPNEKRIFFTGTGLGTGEGGVGDDAAYIYMSSGNDLSIGNFANGERIILIGRSVNDLQRTIYFSVDGATDIPQLVGQDGLRLVSSGVGSDISILAPGDITIDADNDVLIPNGLGVGITPTAYLHIKAGTTAAGTAPLKLTDGPLLTTVEPGAIEYKGHTFYATTFLVRHSIVLAQEVMVSPVTVANTTTETTIYSVAMAADYLTVGKQINTTLHGVFSSVAAAAGVLTIRVKYAGATVVTVASVAGINTASPMKLDLTTICRAIGSGTTGKLKTFGEFSEGATAVSHSRVMGALTNIDTTASNTITITAQWASATASNTVTFEMGQTVCVDANT